MSGRMPQDMPTDKGRQQQIVMVVDARPMRQFYTSIFLQRLQYQVIMAKTAEDALIFLGLTVPLVIIANHDLPRMNGLQLLKRVRQNQRTRSVPFIVYTSNRSAVVRQACEAAGCSAFLSHPCSLEGLYAAVERATKKPRRFVRLATALNVLVGEEHPTDGARSEIITAISERGMFVNTAVPLALGAVLPFTFYLPNAPGWIIKVEGQVLLGHFGSNKARIPGMAVKFLKISDHDQSLVREFIKQELMAGLVAPEKTEGNF